MFRVRVLVQADGKRLEQVLEAVEGKIVGLPEITWEGRDPSDDESRKPVKAKKYNPKVHKPKIVGGNEVWVLPVQVLKQLVTDSMEAVAGTRIAAIITELGYSKTSAYYVAATLEKAGYLRKIQPGQFLLTEKGKHYKPAD